MKNKKMLFHLHDENNPNHPCKVMVFLWSVSIQKFKEQMCLVVGTGSAMKYCITDQQDHTKQLLNNV